MGTDLAQIGHHRFRFLDKIDDQPCHQPLGDGVDLLHDPRQRQHRDVFVPGLARIGRQVIDAVPQQGAGLKHGQLGIGRRPRGRAEDGDIASLPCRHQFLVKVGMLMGDGVAAAAEVVETHQAGIVVLAQAAGVAVDDVFDAGTALGQLQDLVDLLLILGDDDAGPGVVDEVGDLLVEGILIEAEDHGAKGVGRDLATDPRRAVIADEADDIATGDAEVVQAKGHAPHLILIAGPGDFAPDAEFLLPQRHALRPVGGVVGEKLGKGIVDVDVGMLRHQTTASSPRSSCNCSSSSPR